MSKVKSPSVAGMFYPADRKELICHVNEIIDKSKKEYEITTRAVIVPHAGYFYSGKLAYEGIQYLDKNVSNIFIFAPTHHVPFEGIALSSYDEWETPLGRISINREIVKEIEKEFEGQIFDEAFIKEHAVEIQMPLVQMSMRGFKIIPILIGKENYQNIKKIIDFYFDEEENAFIISSDLSHFYKDEEAQQIDSATYNMIEQNNIENFHPAQACGAVGIQGIVSFCTQRNFSMIRIGSYNSGSVNDDISRVVGYGAWLLYQDTKNDFIKRFYSKYVIDTARKSILSHLNGEKYIPENPPEVLKEEGACFVTLEIEKELRGCIGTIIAYRPLIEDIAENAVKAAFSDNRFNPLTQEEFNKVKINISLLSHPKKMHFASQEDLLYKLIPFEDGLIIKDGAFQAVYLPSVWNQLSDKYEFLTTLKQKAGLPPDYFSSTFEAYNFRAVCINED